MPATIYLVTGGCRSGKSSYAEQLCHELCQKPIYVATAKVPQNDEDFAQRIARHQQDRSSKNGWETTIEESHRLSQHASQYKGNAVLVDCLTLWMTNFIEQEGAFEVATEDSQAVTKACDGAFTKIKQEFEALTQPYDTTFVFVTNEVGSGTHAESHLARKFVDYQGWFNQFVASKAQQVIHMVCGQANIIKNELNRGLTTQTKQEAKILEAQRLDRHLSTRTVPMDANGYFLIKTDPLECHIVVSFVSCILNDKGEVCDLQGKKIPCCEGTNRPDPLKVWKCRTAKEMTTEIFERWEFVTQVELTVGHAAYIGREVQRAEHCLYVTGERYQQD